MRKKKVSAIDLEVIQQSRGQEALEAAEIPWQNDEQMLPHSHALHPWRVRRLEWAAVTAGRWGRPLTSEVLAPWGNSEQTAVACPMASLSRFHLCHPAELRACGNHEQGQTQALGKGAGSKPVKTSKMTLVTTGLDPEQGKEAAHKPRTCFKSTVVS